MRAPIVALALVAITLAGCTTAPQPTPAEDEPLDRTVQVTDDRPEPTFGNVTTGPAAAEDERLTLDSPPRWQRGEWWRIKFHSPIDGAEAEYVRVVADVQDGDYVVGMPHEGWYKEAVIYHSPAFGDVNADLSYDTHDELFEPLHWPLTNDATWETQFSGGGPMTAHVQVGEDHTATVTFTQPQGAGPLGLLGPGEEATVLTLVYDAKIHEVREFTHPTVEWQVVEHGYNFTGWITVPRGE
ncbi:MAG TPA: hypothetical protein VGR28_01705, partial [Candidatus Thermoplasmatota archaeon]|nr:hypothetical protein [Candidatus Thermoplasmatota archaeon]